MSAKIEFLSLSVPLNFINLSTDFVNNNNKYACCSLSAILVQVYLDYDSISTWYLG